MSIWIYSVLIESDTVTKLNYYDPAIEHGIWSELNKYAIELDLHCLQYVHYAGDIIFNYSQCQAILKKELP